MYAPFATAVHEGFALTLKLLLLLLLLRLLLEDVELVELVILVEIVILVEPVELDVESVLLEGVELAVNCTLLEDVEVNVDGTDGTLLMKLSDVELLLVVLERELVAGVVTVVGVATTEANMLLTGELKVSAGLVVLVAVL